MSTIDIFRDTPYGGRVDPAEKERRQTELLNATLADVAEELRSRRLFGYPHLIEDPKARWVNHGHPDHHKKWPGSYHVSMKDGKPNVELRFHEDQRESPTAILAEEVLKQKFDVSIGTTAPKTSW